MSIKKEELEELIDAENKNNERRWALREQLLELIYDKELEEIEKWKVEPTSRYGINRDSKI